MADFYGGDTEQMRGHAEACVRGAQRLVDLVDATSALIEQTEWVGSDADAFRSEWTGRVRGAVLSRAEEIRQHGGELRGHAEEQDDASRDGDADFFDIVRNLIDPERCWPGMPLGPLIGWPAPMPIHPLDLRHLALGLGDWFSGGGATGEQEFYGDAGYGGRGDVYGNDRPVGEQFTWNPDLLSGRELDTDLGYVDVHAGANYSAGANVTTDPYGNITGTVGARGSLEAGIEDSIRGPFGTGVTASTNIGMEAYAEAGGTIGPDGASVGASAGSGAYVSQNVTVDGPLGSSNSVSQDLFVGADANAYAYNHVTRNDEGQVNGITMGAGANAFVGASATQTFESTSPGGWFSSSTSISEKVGASAGASAGATLSTDEVSVSVGGSIAAELGFGGSTSFAIHPNAIVDSFTPGDYDLDDLAGDFSGAMDTAGDWVQDNWPF
ncbi:WXG100 family type VII secretion target [Brachybacterium sp. DNPG3]